MVSNPKTRNKKLKLHSKTNLNVRPSLCKGTLHKLHHAVHSLDHELCGNFFLSNTRCLEDKHIIPGPKITNGPGTCQHALYSPYIFHTHPTGTNYYPSFEDLVASCKYVDRMKTVVDGKESVIAGKILHSLIFTPIGIWNISTEHTIKDTNAFIKQNKEGYLASGIEHDLYNALRNKKDSWLVSLVEYQQRVEQYFTLMKMTVRFDMWYLDKIYYI